MLTTIQELQSLIENDPAYEGCGVDLPSGRFIGTTSGCWQPLLYLDPEDDEPKQITWEEALRVYNEENPA